MTVRPRSALVIVAGVAWAGFAATVLTKYGWYLAFNAAVPFLSGLLWLAVFALAAWGAGEPAVRSILESDRESPSSEKVYLQLLSGTAILAAAAGLLAVLHILRPPVVIGMFALFACLGGLSFSRRRQALMTTIPDLPLPWVILVAVAGGVSLGAATTFAPFYDQWHYHLGFPFHWLREGTALTFPRQAYSFFPANMGLLYTYALSGPGGWGAQVIHWWMGALAALGTTAVARRLGASTGGSLLAAAVFAASPAVVQMGALAGSDLGVAAFAVASVVLVLRMIQGKEPSAWVAAAAGLAAGLSAGCKYSALATVLLPLGVVAACAAAANGGPAGRVQRLLTVGLAFGLGAGVTLAPWLLRNAVSTGNPVYPYMERVFSDERAGPAAGDAGVSTGIGNFEFTPDKAVTALTLGTFLKRGRAGDLGPVPLLMSPLVFWFAWRARRRPAMWAAAGYVALAVPAWAAGPPLGRYLLPVVAVIAALIGAAWSAAGLCRPRAFNSIAAALICVVMFANCNPARDHGLLNQFHLFLGGGDTDRYLLDNCTQLEPFRAANAILPPDAKILLVGEPRPFELDRDVIVEDPFRRPLLAEMADRSASAEEIASRLKNMGVTHLLWNYAEADRIAEADHRADYLVFEDEPSRARLNRFLSEFTSSIERGNWWQIFELRN